MSEATGIIVRRSPPRQRLVTETLRLIYTVASGLVANCDLVTDWRPDTLPEPSTEYPSLPQLQLRLNGGSVRGRRTILWPSVYHVDDDGDEQTVSVAFEITRQTDDGETRQFGGNCLDRPNEFITVTYRGGRLTLIERLITLSSKPGL